MIFLLCILYVFFWLALKINVCINVLKNNLAKLVKPSVCGVNDTIILR